MADTRTFSDMVNRITREIRRDNLTSEIKASIVDAIDEVSTERFWFNEGEATGTATAGDFHVNLPLAFVEADTVYYEDTASARYELRPLHWSDIITRDRITNSDPTHYAIHHDSIILYPTPDSRFLIRVSGLREFTDLSASASDGTSNPWTQEAWGMIKPLAKSYLFANRLRNAARAVEQRALAAVAKNRLKMRTSQQISTGRIKKTTF